MFDNNLVKFYTYKITKKFRKNCIFHISLFLLIWVRVECRGVLGLQWDSLRNLAFTILHFHSPKGILSCMFVRYQLFYIS